MAEGDYNSIVDETIEKVREQKDIAEKLNLLLTLDGRQNATIDTLSFVTESTLEFLLKNEKAEIELPLILNCYMRNNKIEIQAQEIPDSKNVKFIFSFEFPLDKWTEVNRSAKDMLKYEAQSCFDELQKLTNSELLGKIENIVYHISHMAPIVYYIEDECYSNFDKLNNLNGKTKDGIRRNLFKFWMSYPLENWEGTDYIFVYFLDLLLQSGLQTRAEEFNGKQISLSILKKYLLDKNNEYESLGIEKTENFDNLSVREQSTILKEKWTELTNDFIFYREIDGLTLQKREKYLLKSNISLENKERTRLSQKLFDEFGIYSDTLEVYRQSLWKYLDEDKLRVKEKFLKLLGFLLTSLSSTTESDIAFSRFFSDIDLLLKLNSEKSYQKIINLPAKSYYCFVVPSENLLQKIPTAILSQMGMAINSRMLYNGWHYMGANFLKDSDVYLEDRDYYFSAIFPDLTYKDKYHHVGHVKLDINNCLRVPLDIQLKGKQYKALMDVRVFRQGTDEYTEKELQETIVYSQYINVLGQTLFEFVQERNLVDFSFGQLNRADYTNYLELLKEK